MKSSLLKIWILSFALLIAMPILAASQSFYSSINAGYGFRISGTNSYGTMFMSQLRDENGTHRESYDFSLGEGMNFGLDFGYKITDNIAAEIGFSYMKGESVKATDQRNGMETNERSMSGEMFRINPSIVISAADGMFVPYVKLGVVFGIANMDFIVLGGNDEIILEFSGGMPVGITGALGMDFKFNENISFFIQATSINMNYFPENGEITKWIDDGEDILSEKTFREKNFKFVKKQNTSENNPNPDPNKAEEVMWTSFPFDSFGFSLGVKFSF